MSVWTRFAAIPAMILAVWSRVWLGWWSLVLVTLVLGWLTANVFVFPPVSAPTSWASKGVYGEKLWLSNRHRFPEQYARLQHRLIALGVVGMLVLAWGLFQLHLWTSILGAVILIVAQLWRLHQFSRLYETYGHCERDPGR